MVPELRRRGVGEIPEMPNFKLPHVRPQLVPQVLRPPYCRHQLQEGQEDPQEGPQACKRVAETEFEVLP
jgi:hypothetical protein